MSDNSSFFRDWKEIKRQPCQIFTRVMGYLRPVGNYNIGKKSEFYSRVYFNENKIKDNNMSLLKRKNANFVNTYMANFEKIPVQNQWITESFWKKEYTVVKQETKNK